MTPRGAAAAYDLGDHLYKQHELEFYTAYRIAKAATKFLNSRPPPEPTPDPRDEALAKARE